jgi:hypothetical protein
LAAVIAALALAIPVAGASAATTVPAVTTPPGGIQLAPGSLPCLLLVGQIRFAMLFGNTVWANFLSNVFIRSGCGGAAI